MIPTRDICLKLFDLHKLPTQKKIHVEEVARLAKFFASKIKIKNPNVKINMELVEAAALLHDIDKNVTKREGERHPDTAVRIMKELGFTELVDIIRKHSVHCILNPELTPTTWEEKLVFLSDKMVKYELIGVDHRFKLWYKEQLPPQAVAELDAAYPKVKALEKEILDACGLTFNELQTELHA